MQPANNIKRNLVLTVGAIIIIAAGAYLFTVKRATAPAAPAASSVTSGTTTTISIPGGGKVEIAGGSGTVKIMPSAAGVAAPDFHTPLVFSAALNLSDDAKAIMNSRLTAAQAALTADPTDFNAWIMLGDTRKLAGDYQGAAADWEYVSVIYPQNTTSFDNLGDLYLNFLKNYPKAERNYTQAIANNPQDVGAYETLYALYTDYGYTGTMSTPENILKEGIKNMPQAIDLHVLLARYYASKGDITDAQTQYAAAISLAQSQNNTAAVTQLQAEAAALK